MADFTPYLSCSRASTGYAQTAAGALTSFAANTLRITDKGLLVEEARTNIIFRSQELDNAYWGKTAMSVTANAVAAPDGTTTADTLTDDGADYYHQLLPSTVTPTAGTVTFSVYAKAGTGSWIQLTMIGWANFNISTGTVGFDSGFAAPRIEVLGDGWYRCSITGNSGGATVQPYFYLLPSDINASTPPTAMSGLTFHIWGFQIENGAYPTSYIPTTSAAVTRAADSVTLIGDADTILSGSAVSAVADMDALPRSATASHIVSSQPTTGHYGLSRASETSVGTYNGTNLSKTGLADARTVATKNGACWSGAGRSVTAEGAAVATDASATAPNLDTIYCGSGGTAFFVDSYMSRLRLWDSRISDADLVTETT